MCVLEISGNWCDVVFKWWLVYLDFLPIDNLSWIFYKYYVDGCSYSLIFWEFCTLLVARFVVQDLFKHRQLLGRYYNKYLWGKARMDNADHFDLLMYFLAPLKALEFNYFEKNAKECDYQRVC